MILGVSPADKIFSHLLHLPISFTFPTFSTYLSPGSVFRLYLFLGLRVPYGV